MKNTPLFSFLFLFALLCLSRVSFAEYRTTGDGTVYTLASLAAASSPTLALQENGCYLLSDKLWLSPGDQLQMTSQTLVFGTQIENPTGNDMVRTTLLIEGTLNATGCTFVSQCTTDTLLMGQVGLLVRNNQTQEPAQAILNGCTLDYFVMGLTAGPNGQVQLTGSTIAHCNTSGANIFGDGQISMQGCTLEAPVTAHGGLLSLKGCHFEGYGVSLFTTEPDTLVEDCTFQGGDEIGIWATAQAKGAVRDCAFSAMAYGAITCDGSEIEITGCAFNQNLLGELVADEGAAPVLRGNTIEHRSGGDPSRPAVLVLGEARPDLGTQASPGGNIFRPHDAQAIYHAGTQRIDALGNTLEADTAGYSFEDFIYHTPDDAADADASGFVSAPVTFRDTATRDMSLYE